MHAVDFPQFRVALGVLQPGEDENTTLLESGGKMHCKTAMTNYQIGQ